MKFLKPILFSAFVIGLSACGAKNANDAAQGAANIKAAGRSGTVNEAKYASTCSPTPKIPALGALVFLSSKTTYELSPVTFKKTVSYYSDQGCTKESLLVSESGKINVVNSPQPSGATQEDFLFDKTSIKPIGDDTTKLLNLQNMCGFTSNEWVTGQERDVSSQAAGASCPGKPSPRTAQELAIIKDGNLYLGGDTDKTQRPDQIDYSVQYTKEN